MSPAMADAVLDCATDPDVTPWRATRRLRDAGESARRASWADVQVYELTDKRLWVRIGLDWTPLEELASSI